MMAFFTEPSHYQKTILSDLQGAWQCLRDAVAERADLTNRDRISFHIDEAMSWETVRHLERMEPLLVLVRNLAVQGEAPAEIMECVQDVAEILQAVRQDLKRGKSL